MCLTRILAPQAAPPVLPPAGDNSDGQGTAAGAGAEDQPDGDDDESVLPPPGGKPVHLLPRRTPPPESSPAGSGGGTPGGSDSPSGSGVGSTSNSSDTSSYTTPSYLARVLSVNDCTFNGQGGAKLKLSLQVNAEEPFFPSFLDYWAEIKLRRPGESNYENLGQILSWRISRPTVQQPEVDPQVWVHNWLTGPKTEFRYPGSTSCIATALRAIYNNDGSVQDRVLPEYHAELSNDGTGNDLVYIQQVYIRMTHEHDDTINVSSCLFSS